MYKLAAGAVVFTAWSVFFLMGVARVDEVSGDGDGGGDGAGASGQVADFYQATQGSNCVCTAANSTTCLCDFVFKIGTVRATAVQCGPCAAGSAANCRVCKLQPILGNTCTCHAAAAPSGGDGGDGATDGDGAAREAFALDGDGAKTTGDSAGDGAKTTGDSAGDGATAAAAAHTCKTGEASRPRCTCSFGATGAAATPPASSGTDGDGTSRVAQALDGDGDTGDAAPAASTSNGFECCCTGATAGRVGVTLGDGDSTGDTAKAAGDAAAGDGAKGDGAAGDGAAAPKTALASGTGKETCKCKLEKPAAAAAAKGGDGDAAATDGDGTAREAVALDGDGGSSGPGVFRPKYGVINGQGCTGRAGCKGSTKQPYYVWTKFVKGDKQQRGGQIYFEWRGDHGMAIGLLMLTWVALFVLMGLVAVVLRMRGVHFRRLCGPLVPGSVASLVESSMLVPLRVSVAELAVCLWVVGWLVLTFLYVWNHAYINNLVGPIPRAIGGMVAGLLTLMLFPVARQSVLLVSFGIPFERALAFHRRMGVWVLVLMLAHFFGMLISHAVYYHHGEPNRPARVYYPGVGRAEAGRKAMARMLKWEIGYPHGPPLAGFIALFVMLAIAVAAAVRRSHWNLFAVVHSLYAVLYVLSWIHYPSLMVWSAVPLLLYVGDLFLRNAQAFCNKARIVSVDTYDSGVTCVTFVRKQAFVPGPAQWVSVRIPSAEKSVAEWHPFSVSSVAQTDEGTRFTIHCKKMGEGEWTDRIRSLEHEEKDALVQGPFGSPMIDVDGADSLLLVAGGVGITAVLGTLSYLAAKGRREQQITVVWSYRGHNTQEAFRDELLAIRESGLRVKVHAHDTAAKGPVTEPVDFADVPEDPEKQGGHGKLAWLETHEGRPDFAAYCGVCAPGTQVLVCGPAPLLHSVEVEARAHSMPVHTEVFEL